MKLILGRKNSLMIRTERANAKINLYLDVISKRENGYHDLVSIMQTLSLCDLVTVEYDPAPQTAIELSASGNSAMPCDCRNLAWRAAELFLRESGKSGRVKIFLEKHIPMEAGLAGGSTDAAAVLRALNHLSGNPFDTAALCALGARLGADVPFCIKGGTALVTGIGDGLEALAPMEDCPLVVAKMGAGISTVWAYGELDRIHNHFQFGKFEQSAADEVLVLSALIADNVKSAILEIRKIRGNRFSVGMNAASFEMRKDIRYNCRMFLIGVIPQIFQYV